MKDEIQRALAPLVGRALSSPLRAANMLALRVGDEHELHIFCPWRIVVDDQIVAGSGDLYTPRDPEAELETFDWEAEGTTWWDYRLEELFAERHAPPVIERVTVDSLGGFRFACSGSTILEVFPSSSTAPHVETEHWRLLRPASQDAHFVVQADGIHRLFDA